MKKIKLFTCVFFGILLYTQYAQAKNWTGKGSAIDDVAQLSGNPVDFSTDTYESESIVYIYNVATGQFLNVGNRWGTELSLQDVGTPFVVEEQRDGTYRFVSSSIAQDLSNYSLSQDGSNQNVSARDDSGYGFIGFMDGVVSSTEDGDYYIDRMAMGALSDFTVTDVKVAAGTPYVYKFSFTPVEYYKYEEDSEGNGQWNKKTTTYTGNTYYMSAKNGKGGAVSYKAVDDGLTTSEQWVFVTKAQLIENFTDSETASDSNPADGTFNIKDPHFNRKNGDVSSWKTGSGLSSNLSNSEKTATPSGNCAKGPITEYYYTGSHEATYTFYSNIGIGGSWKETHTHEFSLWWREDHGDTWETNCFGGYWDNAAGSSGQHSPAPITLKKTDTRVIPAGTKYYVGCGYAENKEELATTATYYCANIHGVGQIAQTINVTASGWYLVSCKGFTTEEGSGKLFFSTYTNGVYGTTEETYKETALTYVEERPSTYYDAGKLITSDSYKSTAMIYVDVPKSREYTTVVFGVKVNDVTEDCAWTCFDDFRIEYCGGPKEVLIILSDQETSIDYINAQVDPDNSYTMILDRHLNSRQWNSLILPVSMTAKQFKDAFGKGAKLSEIKGMNEETGWYRLNFASVDLSNDDATVLQAGKLYIMKPEGLYKRPYGKEFTVYKRDEAKTEFGKITTKNDYCIISEITLAAIPENENGIVTQEGIKGNTETGDLTFKGTYIWQKDEKTIPVGSFLLNSYTGEWHHTQSKTYSVKGFRAWIECNPNGKVKEVTFYNDGVEMGGDELSDISDVLSEMGVNASGNVYNLKGQLVRKGISLEGLAKGVYIVNGKKYIVK